MFSGKAGQGRRKPLTCQRELVSANLTVFTHHMGWFAGSSQLSEPFGPGLGRLQAALNCQSPLGQAWDDGFKIPHLTSVLDEQTWKTFGREARSQNETSCWPRSSESRDSASCWETRRVSCSWPSARDKALWSSGLWPHWKGRHSIRTSTVSGIWRFPCSLGCKEITQVTSHNMHPFIYYVTCVRMGTKRCQQPGLGKDRKWWDVLDPRRPRDPLQGVFMNLLSKAPPHVPAPFGFSPPL